MLRAALGKAENWNLIARNPAGGKRVTTPRAEKHEVLALSPQEAQAIVAAFRGHPFEALVYTALATGLRQGELLGRRWADVALETGTLTVRYQLQRIAGKPVLTLPLPRLTAGVEWRGDRREAGRAAIPLPRSPLSRYPVVLGFIQEVAPTGRATRHVNLALLGTAIVVRRARRRT